MYIYSPCFEIYDANPTHRNAAMSNTIKTLLVDDHAVVRAGFRMLLSFSGDVEVVAEAERGEQAIQRYHECKPDLVVMDLSMPGIGGLEAIRRIVARDADARILVYSIYHEQVYVRRAFEAGAQGYITKNMAPNLLLPAIESIMQGKSYAEPGLLTHAEEPSADAQYQAQINAFSPREFDIFRLLAQGLTVSKISAHLCLGKKTIANYATQIKKKLQVQTTTELAHIAVNLNILNK